MEKTSKWFNYLQDLLSSPVFVNEEEKTRIAYMLNTVLWSMTLITGIDIIMAIVGGNPPLNSLIVTSLYGVFLLGLRIPLHQGRVKAASSLFIIVSIAGLTLYLIVNGTIRAPATVYYIFACIFAGLLIGRRAAVVTALAICLIVMSLVYAEVNDLLPDPVLSVTMAQGITLIVGIFLTVQLLNMATRSIDDALMRARHELSERQKVESALRTSEEHFRLTSQVTSDYTFSSRFNAQGELEHVLLSGAFEAITGYTSEEFLARGGWRTTLHPDDMQQDERDIAALKENRRVVTEVRTIRKDGEICWVRVAAHPVWDAENNRLIGINGGVQDITERKLAEDALRESELRYRSLIEASPDMIVVSDYEGQLLYANPTFQTRTGLTLDDVRQLGGGNMLIHPDDRELVADAIRNLIPSENQHTEIIENRVVWDETTYWYSGVICKIHYKGTPALVLISRDITGQKTAEQAILDLNVELQAYASKLEILVDERTNSLRRTKEQMELILNTTTNALAFADPDGDILMTNPAFLAMFDEGGRQYIEGILASVIDEKHTVAICHALLRVFYDNETQRLEAQISSNEGQELDVDLTLVPVNVGEDDSRQGILLSGHDITQMKEIERFKARFVADAVHDLATPISGLSTRLYLLQRSPEKLTDHVRALENQVQHLKSLLGDLRTLSRMDRGQIMLKMEAFNLNELAQRVFDIYEPVAIDKQQSLKLEADLTLPDLSLDQRLIERVLVNLVSNAINYTPEQKEIRIQTATEGNVAIVRVTDQGIGIDAEDIPHVFERFYRTTEARETLSSGTGLGLAITKEVLEMHGGSVTVTSEKGKGSTFTARLPLRI